MMVRLFAEGGSVYLVIVGLQPMKLLNSVERTVRNELKQEVPTEVIGNLIMEELRKLDQVAYVRFASVYREFKDLSSFMSELETLMKNGKTEGTDSKNDQN